MCGPYLCTRMPSSLWWSYALPPTCGRLSQMRTLLPASLASRSASTLPANPAPTIR